MRFPLCLSLPLGAAIRESSDLTAPLLFNTQNALNKLLLYYINTDQGTSRRLHMQEQASELALPLHRFRAVDSIAIASGLYDDKYILAQGVDSNLHAAGRDHTQNATIACFVSHVELLAEIAGSFSGDCIVLIMEDDVLIPADVLQRITHALECAPPDWTLLKVSSWGAVRSSNVVRQKRSVWQATHLEALPWLHRVSEKPARSITFSRLQHFLSPKPLRHRLASQAGLRLFQTPCFLMAVFAAVDGDERAKAS
ncbi:unnamed protein product [Effrenium voratum]|uniref:Glycosyl transferase family 25 domain-containing protein n=1 Tax=Effrenium voratum TaxID=2562239 RepID=A0AA36I7B3_9DINO|nr:unnamed protein product [Effrenium voratum]CAJ1437418.1 unnamed protein product [Effrenium voratum]